MKNIFNIIFDNFKTGNQIIDTFITTIILSFITYLIQLMNNNFYFFIFSIKTINYDYFKSYLYKKYIVEYDGKIGLTTTYYDNNLNQTNSFSDRFKALWFHIIENISENDSINHIKEYSFDSYSNSNNKRDLGIYMVVQETKFLI
jgi:hypothetical protein